jgi:saccharopine dehydrogenase-like NADP-dependent oxidoreductase
MKVVIIGAGEQGYVLTWKLASNPAVDEIVVADSDEKRAQDVATRVGAGKAVAALVDALDVEQVAAIAIGAELPSRLERTPFAALAVFKYKWAE